MVMLLQIRGLGGRRGKGDQAFTVELPALDPRLAEEVMALLIELIGSSAAGAVLATHEQARVEGLGLRAFRAQPRERGAGARTGPEGRLWDPRA